MIALQEASCTQVLQINYLHQGDQHVPRLDEATTVENSGSFVVEPRSHSILSITHISLWYTPVLNTNPTRRTLETPREPLEPSAVSRIELRPAATGHNHPWPQWHDFALSQLASPEVRRTGAWSVISRSRNKVLAPKPLLMEVTHWVGRSAKA